MILRIDPKYIEDTVKRRDDYGNVYVKYAVFEPRYENMVVKEPIPVLGRIFPFLKRSVRRFVNTGKQDLVLHEERVDIIRSMGESAPKAAQGAIKKMPFKRIVKLDEATYGDLYVGHLKDQKYNILTKEGVVIGQFAAEGYYYPYMNGLLPKEARESRTEHHQSCEPIAVEDIVASYMAKNPDSKEFIPQNLYDKFPDLDKRIKEESQKVSSQSKTKSENAFSLR